MDEDELSLEHLPRTPLRAYKVDLDNLTVDNVLTYALGSLEDVVLMGKDKNGEMYFASTMNREEIFTYIKRFKKILKEPYVHHD